MAASKNSEGSIGTRIVKPIVLLIFIILGVAAFRDMVRGSNGELKALAQLLGTFPFASLMVSLLQKISDGSNNQYDNFLSYLAAFCTCGMIASIIKTLLIALLKPVLKAIIQGALVPVKFKDWKDAERYMKSAHYRLLITFWEAVFFPILVWVANRIMTWAEEYVQRQFGSGASLVLGIGGTVVVVLLTLLISGVMAAISGVAFASVLGVKTLFTLLRSALQVFFRDFLCFAIYVSLVAGAPSAIAKAVLGLVLWLLIEDLAFQCMKKAISEFR